MREIFQWMADRPRTMSTGGFIVAGLCTGGLIYLGGLGLVVGGAYLTEAIALGTVGAIGGITGEVFRRVDLNNRHRDEEVDRRIRALQDQITIAEGNERQSNVQLQASLRRVEDLERELGEKIAQNEQLRAANVGFQRGNNQMLQQIQQNNNRIQELVGDLDQTQNEARNYRQQAEQAQAAAAQLRAGIFAARREALPRQRPDAPANVF